MTVGSKEYWEERARRTYTRLHGPKVLAGLLADPEVTNTDQALDEAIRLCRELFDKTADDA